MKTSILIIITDELLIYAQILYSDKLTLILGGKLFGVFCFFCSFLVFLKLQKQYKPRINLCTQSTQVYTWRLHSG